MRHVGSREIEEVADLAALIAEMEEGIESGRRVRMITPLRTLISNARQRGVFLAMPSYSDEYGIYTAKVGAVVNSARAAKRSSVNTVVVAFDALTGEPLASLEGSSITRLKCAAIAGLVSKYCTPHTATTLGVIGAGALARAQIEGVARVRKISRVKLFSRRSDAGEKLASTVQPKLAAPLRIEIVSSIEAAVRDQEIVGTATTSAMPLVEAEWLSENVHVNCMGARTEDEAEVSREVLRSSTIVVEDVETAVQEGGEIHRTAMTIEDMASTDIDILRTSRTVFSSSGHGSLDLIATVHVLSRLGLRAHL